MNELPLLPLAAEPPPVERADAARNRARVLAAAERLFVERDPATVTMDDIAKAAGIGRGTLYRRYPDRASIARALLDQHERALQERLIRGAAPLGPGEDASGEGTSREGKGNRNGGVTGAAPAERLAAFYAAMVDLLETHVHLVLGAETGEARYGTGAYAFWRLHVTHLVREAGLEDPEALADQLLAPLAPELFRHQRGRGITTERIKRGLAALAHGTLGARPLP
ncbi:TetR/AcrR family transcriptional regulator [Streptomyces sp. NPDC050504]|uniref:TetR/AcrR family transcriptional regulator n=1 Tax=Streptomyces sp. NPDC050504 TaxID=3365618 RepID=UPI0037BC1D49